MVPYVLVGVLGVSWGFIVGILLKKKPEHAYRMRYVIRFVQATSFFLVFVWQFDLIAHINSPQIVYRFFGALGSHVFGFVIGAVIAFFFDDDDWKKRFKEKTSRALRRLLQMVKEATASHDPLPSPA